MVDSYLIIFYIFCSQLLHLVFVHTISLTSLDQLPHIIPSAYTLSCLLLNSCWAVLLHLLLLWPSVFPFSRHIRNGVSIYGFVNMILDVTCSKGLFLCIEKRSLGIAFQFTFPYPLYLTFPYFVIQDILSHLRSNVHTVWPSKPIFKQDCFLQS